MKSLKKVLLYSIVLSIPLIFSAFISKAESIGTVTADVLNFREGPDINSAVITRLYYGDQVTVLEGSEGWYKVVYGDFTGWVYGQYLSVYDSSVTYGTITGNSVNIRTGPGTWYDVITMQNRGDVVTILGSDSGWYNVQLSDGTVGWVIERYLSVGISRSEGTADRIVEFAKRYLGVGYLYGGSSPNGFDCSGFVKYVYNNFGINLERVAADQAQQGVWVDKADLMKGDLVFFDTNGGYDYINHVGIYIGNGQFIHASSGAGKVVISSLTYGFYSNSYMTARRFIR